MNSRGSYLEEKTRLDIEYRLEELKKDIRTQKSPDELIEKLEDLERFVMRVYERRQRLPLVFLTKRPLRFIGLCPLSLPTVAYAILR